MVEGESCEIVGDGGGGQLGEMIAQAMAHSVRSDNWGSVSDEWLCRHLVVVLDHLWWW